MSFGNIDFYLIFDMFLLLLIGLGPKIALVPFIDLTKTMDAETQLKVANKMVSTAISTSLILVILGWFLMRLLHFTSGAANIAGGDGGDRDRDCTAGGVHRFCSIQKYG